MQNLLWVIACYPGLDVNQLRNALGLTLNQTRKIISVCIIRGAVVARGGRYYPAFA